MTSALPADRVIAAGRAQGPALRLSEGLSFWGGVDPRSGLIVDARLPERGASVSGTVLLLPGLRGSSNAPGALVEMLRLGTGPAGIVVGRAEVVLLTAAFVADELYGRGIPVYQLDEARWPGVPAGTLLEMKDGEIGLP